MRRNRMTEPFAFIDRQPLTDETQEPGAGRKATCFSPRLSGRALAYPISRHLPEHAKETEHDHAELTQLIV
jgi:hypothetical protein